MNKIEKQLKIANEVIVCSTKIKKELFDFPRFKKGGLIKTYNRRPMKRKRQAKGVATILLDAITASVNIARILSMPMPKHNSSEIKNYKGESI